MATGQTTQPGSTYQRLKYFEGFWVYTGRLEGSEFGVAAPNRHTESCEMIGERFVTSRYDVSTVRDSYNGIGIVGYDEKQDAFTFVSYDSRGVITNLRAPANDSKWVWSADDNIRVVWEPFSPTSYAFRIEVREAEGTWRVVDEGRYDRVRARASGV